MLFLGYTEKMQRDKGEDFWSVYFIAPLAKDNNSFVIDNREDAALFHYEIRTDETIISTEDISVPTKDRVLITTKDIQNTSPIIITITKDDTKKELTKK